MTGEKKRFVVSLEMIVTTEAMGTLEVMDRVTDSLIAEPKMQPDFKKLFIRELEGEQ